MAVIEFILWAVEISGIKLSRKKAKILHTKIKWLGHQYDSDLDQAGIPDERQNAFEKLRHPRSIAELNSRLGGFMYFQTYLPEQEINRIVFVHSSKSRQILLDDLRGNTI